MITPAQERILKVIADRVAAEELFEQNAEARRIRVMARKRRLADSNDRYSKADYERENKGDPEPDPPAERSAGDLLRPPKQGD